MDAGGKGISMAVNVVPCVRVCGVCGERMGYLDRHDHEARVPDGINGYREWCGPRADSHNETPVTMPTNRIYTTAVYFLY